MIPHTLQPQFSETKRKYQILLIEDDPAEIYLTQDAIEGGKLSSSITLQVAMDGRQAHNLLMKPELDVITPDLILLDLHLPYINGYDLLKEIKGDQTLKNIPVIILTSSVSDEAIDQTYRLNANGYLSKPVGCEALNEVIRLFKNYWVPQRSQG